MMHEETQRYSPEVRAIAVDRSMVIGVRAAALEFGCAASTITRWTKKMGLGRPRTPAIGGRGLGYSPEFRAAVVRCALDVGPNCASRKFGCGAASVWRWSKAAQQ